MTESIRDLYNKEAETFAAYAENSFSWQYIESRALDRLVAEMPVNEMRVLDIGSGSGRVMQHLHSLGARAEGMVGIDTSSKMIDVARSKLPYLSFIKANGLALPLKSASFDLVTSNMMVHALQTEELNALLNEVYTALKIGGTFFIIDRAIDKRASLNDENVGNWQLDKTPWGSETPVFNHNMWKVICDQAFAAGFVVTAEWPLPISDEGKAETAAYHKYAAEPSRIALRLTKLPPKEKQLMAEFVREAPEFPSSLIEALLERQTN